MKKYDRKADTKNIESQANRYNNTSKSGYQGRGRYNRGPRRERDLTPPSYLSEYEKSVWRFNSFNRLSVKRRENDSNDSMVRRFRKMVEGAGVMREVKKREFYLTPSQKKREKKKRAMKRLRKQMKIDNHIQEQEDRRQEERQQAQNGYRNNRGGGDA